MLYKKNELGDLVIDDKKAARLQRSMFPELYRQAEERRTRVPRDFTQEFKEDLAEGAVGVGILATVFGAVAGTQYVLEAIAPYLQ